MIYVKRLKLMKNLELSLELIFRISTPVAFTPSLTTFVLFRLVEQIIRLFAKSAVVPYENGEASDELRLLSELLRTSLLNPPCGKRLEALKLIKRVNYSRIVEDCTRFTEFTISDERKYGETLGFIGFDRC